MSFTIFLCGHGSHDPENGFVSVPKGCSVTFYAHYMKTVLAPQTEKLVSGSFQGEPHNVVEEFHTCANQSLHPPTGSQVQDKYAALTQNPNKENCTIFFAEQTITLGQFFSDYGDQLRVFVNRYGGVNLVWSCCRSVKFGGVHLGTRKKPGLAMHLKKADEIGVNAIDLFADKKYLLRYKKRGLRSEVNEYKKIGRKKYG